MKMIDYNLLKGKIVAMQSTEPEYAFNFLNDAQNPSTEWECIEDMLDSMEVYEAEPVKHGKWVRTDKSMGVETVYACSECGYQVRESDRTNYCGDCGSKLDIIYQDDKVTAIKVTGW